MSFAMPFLELPRREAAPRRGAAQAREPETFVRFGADAAAVIPDAAQPRSGHERRAVPRILALAFGSAKMAGSAVMPGLGPGIREFTALGRSDVRRVGIGNTDAHVNTAC
ncbi:MAG TPA: hypothetical protein VHD15_01160 [Hyphomicrobiales bacterium]|nr:hypothetical protein [Hyphomicrobiales bacterium]